MAEGWREDGGLHEECGVFGVYDPAGGCAQTVYYGLYALQHRGQEACGIAAVNNREQSFYKDVGLVSEVFSRDILEKLNGTMVFTGFFERLISLLDFENAAVALIDEDEEDAIRDFFQMLVSYYTVLFQKLHTCCGIDIVTFHDDWGHQRGTFFSERVCRNLLLPYLKATVDACQQAGITLL